ncbi:MAG: hypothetical protein MUE42_15485, partial [Opitutaceae bacterium]|nr:hypothetical protein [Opitutaceae bacterium]
AEWAGVDGLAGKLAIFKAGLVAAEAAGCWALWRVGGARALLFAAWCPLAVTEIAFAGHVDAWVFAAVAGALALQASGGTRAARAGACGVLALACAAKAYAILLAPFFIWKAGWRGLAVFVAVLAASYAPWMVATHLAGREIATVWGAGGVGAMAGGFEFNSTGYALLAWTFGEGAGRWLAAVAMAGGLGVIWLRWAAQPGAREADGGAWGAFVTNLVTKCGEKVARGLGATAADARVPGALVVGWWALWSPVFHPWYALLALPFLALRPSGWGVGLLAALPLSYVHGLTLGAGASGDYRHPFWVRPAEVLLVAAGAGVARLRAGRRAQKLAPRASE